MNYFINGILTTKDKLLRWIRNPKTKVHKLTFEFENENKPNGPTTMEGFDITADYLIAMAEKSNEMNAEVTATFSNCGKLGGKTVIIKVI